MEQGTVTHNCHTCGYEVRHKEPHWCPRDDKGKVIRKAEEVNT